jgi:hypothetical protein
VSYPQTTPSTHNRSPEPATSGRQPSAQRVKRPGSVLALLVTTVGSALFALVGAVIVFTGGSGLADSNVKDVIAKHPDVVGLPPGMGPEDVKSLAGPLWQGLVDDRAGTLSARAGFAVFVAACMLLFAFFARKKAATWSRVMITVSGLVGLIPYFLIVTDYEPASVTAVTWAALVCGVVAVVLCWLPGVRRYAEQH